MLRIRLRRTGAKKQPHYRVVVAEARSPRDGAFVEILGFYNPLVDPPAVRIDTERALYWVGRGAVPSDTVVGLFKRAGVGFERAAVSRQPSAVSSPLPVVSDPDSSSGDQPSEPATEDSPPSTDDEDLKAEN